MNQPVEGRANPHCRTATSAKEWTPARLESLALAAASELETATAEDIVRWAVETFASHLAATSSMADGVIAHLVSLVKPDLDMLFIDTGLHFDETIRTRDAIAAAYRVKVVEVTPAVTVAEQDTMHGPRLWARAPDLCCALRKKAALEQALAPYHAWIAGVRRDESPSRADTRVVSWDAAKAVVKICPIARWSQEQLNVYIARHNILVNPLLAEGYTSIGCRPCTRPTRVGEDARAGRWAGFAKTECGIH